MTPDGERVYLLPHRFPRKRWAASPSGWATGSSDTMVDPRMCRRQAGLTEGRWGFVLTNREVWRHVGH